jgi:hypothetical protein
VCNSVFLFFILNFSVSTATRRRFTGVVGTRPIVRLSANKNIGTKNTRRCAEEKDKTNKITHEDAQKENTKEHTKMCR